MIDAVNEFQKRRPRIPASIRIVCKFFFILASIHLFLLVVSVVVEVLVVVEVEVLVVVEVEVVGLVVGVVVKGIVRFRLSLLRPMPTPKANAIPITVRPAATPTAIITE
jgi:hypothetical protein